MLLTSKGKTVIYQSKSMVTPPFVEEGTPDSYLCVVVNEDGTRSQQYLHKRNIVEVKDA
jgi:hypothetical protein